MRFGTNCNVMLKLSLIYLYSNLFYCLFIQVYPILDRVVRNSEYHMFDRVAQKSKYLICKVFQFFDDSINNKVFQISDNHIDIRYSEFWITL